MHFVKDLCFVCGEGETALGARGVVNESFPSSRYFDSAICHSLECCTLQRATQLLALPAALHSLNVAYTAYALSTF